MTFVEYRERGVGGVMCAMCDGRSIEDYVVGVQGLINRYGWALQYVDSELSTEFRGDTDVREDGLIVPAFCYTVGLTEHGHPELVVTGRSAGESAAVLNVLARRVLLGGERFEAGNQCVAAGLRMSFVDVEHTEDWLMMAARVQSGVDIRARQAVWRDAEGHLPWEGPYPSTIVQPVLGPPPGWFDSAENL
ncbi:DUF4262 domain-containing protein [Rhodococcus sp. G-MC3]|uniref:DUF4262 domain-containing protein n=1 Tax=Rhodococcus sp. G-MC3 TaxID=3046209 RepID=UPI0024BB6E6F|nr:DUF4262 domain-containing protein [Rhodococcus sp. G-MC3]MDJ0394113.1 DUF4262 domain-containing protein [Rhodococcus sp. G-MC3]